MLEGSPTLAAGELHQLYRVLGWVAYLQDPDTLPAAIAGSSYVVAARRDGRLVGLARVISDGVSICYLQDVLVEPGLHRTGIAGPWSPRSSSPTQPSGRRSSSPTPNPANGTSTKPSVSRRSTTPPRGPCAASSASTATPPCRRPDKAAQVAAA